MPLPHTPTPPQTDYDIRLGAAINSMSQGDACGQVIGMRRDVRSRNLESVVLDPLATTNWEDFELVIFDGGNTHGDAWKMIFAPQQRSFLYVDEASLNDPQAAVAPPAPCFCSACATAH